MSATRNIFNINPEEYGSVREYSEGTLYIMKKLAKPAGWAEEVAFRLNKRWMKSDDKSSRYRVMQSDVQWFEKSDLPSLLKIVLEAELNPA